METSQCIMSEEDVQGRVEIDSLCFVYIVDIFFFSNKEVYIFFFVMFCLVRKRFSFLV